MIYFKNLKERNHSLESDLEQLKNATNSYEERFAIIYRLEKKKIIRSNIDLIQYLLSILK